MSICGGGVVRISHSGKGLRVGRGAAIDASDVRFGDSVIIGRNAHIFGGGRIEIGSRTIIGDGAVLCAAERISIGDDVMIAAGCRVYDCNHGMHVGKPMRIQKLSVRPVSVGNDCWLGANVVLLAGSALGDGVVVGAGAAVDGAIPEGTIIRPRRDFESVSRV